MNLVRILEKLILILLLMDWISVRLMLNMKYLNKKEVNQKVQVFSHFN